MGNIVKEADSSFLGVADKFYQNETYPTDRSFPVFTAKNYYRSKGRVKGFFARLLDVLITPAITTGISGLFLYGATLLAQNFFLGSTLETVLTAGFLYPFPVLFGGLMAMSLNDSIKEQFNFGSSRLIPATMVTGLQKWVNSKYDIALTETQAREILLNNRVVIDGDFYSLEADKNGNYSRVIQAPHNKVTYRELGSLTTDTD